MAQRNNYKPIKWRTIVGLILVYLAVWFNWYWVWGILFLLWVVPDILSGVTYFMEPIEKKEHPVLFWIIVITWLLMSFFFIGTLVFPEWKSLQ